MATLERAVEIAASAHTGQQDKGGEPYILHPIRVMLRMVTEEQRIVAMLHDVVEDDSEWTIERLTKEGFSAEIIDAVDALTKRPDESRVDAAERVAGNPLACVVKLADNAENSDLSRIPNPTARDHERLREYRQVREILLTALR